MYFKVNLIEPIIVQVRRYGNTSFELIRLELERKRLDFFSKWLVSVLIFNLISYSVLILNIAIAFWHREILGKTYKPYFIVTAFYGLFGMMNTKQNFDN